MDKFIKAIRQAHSKDEYLKICRKFKSKLDQEIPASVSSDYNQTLLHCAATVDNAELAEALIEAGANIEAKDREGLTPIYRAVSNSSIKVLRCLLKAGAITTAPKNYSYSPLHRAVKYSFAKGVKLLIAAGADVRARAADGEEPIHYINAGHSINIHELLCADAAMDVLGAKQRNSEPSLVTIRKRAYKCLQLLLENGADINALDQFGSNAVQIKIYSCDPHITKKLIESGVSVNHPNHKGKTALHILLGGSLSTTDTRNLKVLLENGANPNLKDQDGKTPLNLLEHNPKIPTKWRRRLVKIIKSDKILS